MGARRSLLQQLPFIVVVGLFVVSSFAVEVVLGHPGFLELGIFSPRLLAGLALYIPLLVLHHATRVAFVQKEDALSRQSWRAFASEHLSPKRILPALLLLGLLGPLMSTFVSYKALIPEINPFSWDTGLHGARLPAPRRRSSMGTNVPMVW